MKEDFLRQFKYYYNTSLRLENELKKVAEENAYLECDFSLTLPFKIGERVKFSKGIGQITGIKVTYLPQSETSPHDILVEYRVIPNDSWKRSLQGTAEDLELEKIED